MRKTPVIILYFLLLVLSKPLWSQEEKSDSDSSNITIPRKSKFLTGFYIGSYFANKYSAATYNGYGFDLNGKQNSFQNSLMFQKIKNEYGGGFGQADLIAEALNVDPGRWEFNESDMPVNMRYLPAILLGFNFKIPVAKKDAIIVNINGSRINVEGNFSITTLRPLNSPNPALRNNIVTCAIKGQEQRLQFQLGYQKIFGDDEKLNFFGEIGFVGTLAKYDKNWIQINSLRIDLTYYLNQAINPAPVPGRVPVGFGLGAFAGTGLNISINPKITIQFLYTLSHEKVNFGVNPVLKLQHGIGMRGYYNF